MRKKMTDSEVAAALPKLAGWTLKIAMVNGQEKTVSILFDQPAKTILHSPIHIKILLFL